MAKRRRHKLTKFKRKALCLALIEHHGNKAATAAALDIDRKLIDYYIKTYEDVAAAASESLEYRLDKAESCLDKIAFSGEVEVNQLNALKFLLSTMGRSRGYGTEPPKPSAPTKHTHTLIVKPREPEDG